MTNFDVSIVYCCLCLIDLVQYEVCTRKQKRVTLTKALIVDYIKARCDFRVLIEVFTSIESVLFTCFKHLIECLNFD